MNGRYFNSVILAEEVHQGQKNPVTLLFAGLLLQSIKLQREVDIHLLTMCD